MMRTIPLVLALALILTAGYLHGHLSQRWEADYDFASAAKRLQSIPLELGDWRGKDSAFEAEKYINAGIRCGLEREYRNSITGHAVKILIVAGAPGPISVHLPETCYAAAGYEIVGKRMPYQIDAEGKSPATSFWYCRMQQETRAIAHDLLIHYSWSHDGRWRAPEGDARIAFVGVPALFKLYVVQELRRGQDLSKDNPAEAFIKDALPGLTAALFSVNTADVTQR